MLLLIAVVSSILGKLFGKFYGGVDPESKQEQIDNKSKNNKEKIKERQKKHTHFWKVSVFRWRKQNRFELSGMTKRT